MNEAIIKIVFVCPHTYLPKKKPLTPMFLLSFLKNNNFFFFNVYSKIRIPKPILVLVIVFCRDVRRQRYKTVIKIQFTIRVYMYVLVSPPKKQQQKNSLTYLPL